jgi:hypothetical protein
MHRWDCSCGTPNAPEFARCRRCGAPIARGRPVAPEGEPTRSRPQVGADLAPIGTHERNRAAGGWGIAFLILAGFAYPLAWLLLLAWGFAVIVEASWVSMQRTTPGDPARPGPIRRA